MHDTPVPSSPASGTTAPAIDPIFLSVKDAAKALSLSSKAVYRLMDQGEIENTWHGTRRLVFTESLRAYAERLLSSGKPATARKGRSAA
jgi:excisionase family DNA binding protein